MSEPLRIYIALIIIVPLFVVFASHVLAAHDGGISAILFFLSLISTHVVFDKMERMLH